LGGPRGNQPEWVVNTLSGVYLLNRYIQIFTARGAWDVFNQQSGRF
jgi:hypothetical protein